MRKLIEEPEGAEEMDARGTIITPRGIKISELIELIREKLDRGLRLTQREADEALNIANLRDFPGQVLDLSGMTLSHLNLDDGVIGQLLMQDSIIQGDFFRDGLKIERGCYERGLTVGGNVSEIYMRIGGEWVESGKNIRGYCDRQGLRVNGPHIAIGMQVFGDLNERRTHYQGGSYESGMQIGGNWRQVEKKVRGDLVQDGASVLGDLDRRKLRVVGGNLSQDGLRYGGQCKDSGMKVKSTLCGKPVNQKRR